MSDSNLNKKAHTENVAEDSFDIFELWRTIRKNRKQILAIFVSVVILTLFLTSTTEPIFQATTVVMVKENQSNPGSFVFDFGMGNSKQQLQNEIAVLTSYNLHDQVVNSLIADGSADELSLFGTKYIRKRYRLIGNFMDWIGRGSDTFVSPKNLDFEQRVEIIEKLRMNTIVSTVRDADVINIAVNSTDSSDAVFLANRISTIYRNLDLEGGLGELHFVLTFLDSQITKYENRLTSVENALEAWQSEYQVYSLDGSAKLLLDELTGYEGIYFKNIAELEVAQGRVKYLQDQLSEGEKVLIEEITNTNNPMIVALRGKIAELEAQKIQQMVDEGWGEGSLQSKDFNRRISEMKDQLTKITESLILSGWSEENPFAASQELFNRIIEQQVEVNASKTRSIQYKKLVDKMSSRLADLPSQTLQLARLERELRLNENLYLTMKQKYEESRITQAGQLGKVRILDPALLGERIRPNRKENLFWSIFMGLVIGIVFALVREYLDVTVTTIEQLERKGLTVLGIIPDMGIDSKVESKVGNLKPSQGGQLFKRRLITHENPKSPISESYRSLRTNITYAFENKKVKSLVISSAEPGEGKSTTSANLAIAYAQLKKKTLFIDSDLRKPVQHNVFGVSRSPGLAEYLTGEYNDISKVIQETEIENLYLISAGNLPPNPSELLGSERLSVLVDALEREWDMIIFDSPPIVAVTDASMISREIDAVAIVVKAGQTNRNAVDRALDTLANVRSPLIGIILNSVNPETLGGKYSYYYSYYNYYYTAEKQQ